MVACNPLWHYVVEQIEAQKITLTLPRIAASNLIPGVAMITLAHEVYSFLGTIIGATVHKKRLRLAGGEKGNGFEMWRRMFFDNQGGGELADLTGERFFFNYPRCTDAKHLHDHVEEWLETRFKHGTGLDDKHLRIMFLSTLPQALEDEISLNCVIENTLAAAVEFVQARTNRSRERELVERLAKGRRTALGVSALTQDIPAPPTAHNEARPQPVSSDLISQLMAALNAQSGNQKRGRTTQKGGGSGRGTPTRSTSPGNKNRPNPKSGLCWHCGEPSTATHTRQTCPKFKALLKANGGKMPSGYKGKFDHAPSKIVSAVTGALNTEALLAALKPEADSDDSDTESQQSRRSAGGISMFALPQWTHVSKGPAAAIPPRGKAPTDNVVRNSFTALRDLDDSDGNDEEDMMSHLNSIAHSVQVQSKKKSQKQKRKDKLLAKVLPVGMTSDYQHAVRVMANLQIEEPIEHDEEWALVDSGSGVHGCNPKTHLKRIPVTPTDRKLKCTTADGSPMLGTGGIQSVTFTTIEGHECAVDFDELPVAMPIISVKLMAKRGHAVVFDDDLGGGSITNKATKQRSQIIEREGVYFIKMNKIRPTPQKPASHFGRPGPSN